MGSVIRSLVVMAPSKAPLDQERPSSAYSQSSVAAAFVSTPLDRLQLQSEGSAIWAISQSSPSDQLEEMIVAGRYADGLGLLKALPEGCGVDKVGS
jgi:Vam6/Vps39-like protein vacuolar protein sorting-associated protein 39